MGGEDPPERHSKVSKDGHRLPPDHCHASCCGDVSGGDDATEPNKLRDHALPARRPGAFRAAAKTENRQMELSGCPSDRSERLWEVEMFIR
jgi:hypothetical protein